MWRYYSLLRMRMLQYKQVFHTTFTYEWKGKEGRGRLLFFFQRQRQSTRKKSEPLSLSETLTAPFDETIMQDDSTLTNVIPKFTGLPKSDDGERSIFHCSYDGRGAGREGSIYTTLPFVPRSQHSDAFRSPIARYIYIYIYMY